MGREIQFDTESMTLKLNGITGIFALKLKLKIQYNIVKSVYVDYFDTPQWMLRMPELQFRHLTFLKVVLNMQMSDIFFLMKTEYHL